MPARRQCLGPRGGHDAAQLELVPDEERDLRGRSRRIATHTGYDSALERRLREDNT
uniref:Uncharacterized protein n=1 Tax=Setaria italica TaxID=4555 RepID=K3ZYZ5_SETIT